ncbi:unnamed protein product, partial [Rotaria sp. Silwood1]
MGTSFQRRTIRHKPFVVTVIKTQGWPEDNQDKRLLPLTEFLKDAIVHASSYQHDNMYHKFVPVKMYLCTHGTSLRALIKYLDK